MSRPFRDRAVDVPWTLVFGAVTAVVAGVLGVVAAGTVDPLPPPLAGALSPVVDLPPVAVVVAVLVVVTLPWALVRWPLPVGGFFVWLVLEDLVRKLAGNDLRVYFVKDLIFLVVLLAILKNRGPGRLWREATGRTRYWLYALVLWAVAMAVPAAFADPRIPLIGLRLNFMYLPLVVAGYLAGRDPRTLRRWLVALAALGGVASLVGVVQAVVGPSFLAPGVAVEGLPNLVLFRGDAATGAVYRPTGTFVDPGRFNSMSVVALAIALAAVPVARGRARWIAVAAAVAAGTANLVSGGRAGILVSIVLVATSAVAVPFALRRLSLTHVAQVATAAVVGGVILASTVPGLVESRLAWYQQTLDPRSSQNEWAFRFNAYVDNTAHGVASGGVLGQGTGTESLGLQYLGGRGEMSDLADYTVEGGYASIAVELGFVGLLLWIVWSVAWARRQWSAVRSARGSPGAAAGLVLFAWMLFFLFVGFAGGLQGFQNYLANAYFWFLSGVLFALPAAVSHSRIEAASAGTPG